MMQRFGKFKIRGNNGEFEVPASTSARLIDHFRLIFFPVLSDVSFFFFSINVRLSSCVFSPGSNSSGPDSLLYALLRALTRIYPRGLNSLLSVSPLSFSLLAQSAFLLQLTLSSLLSQLANWHICISGLTKNTDSFNELENIFQRLVLFFFFFVEIYVTRWTNYLETFIDITNSLLTLLEASAAFWAASKNILIYLNRVVRISSTTNQYFSMRAQVKNGGSLRQWTLPVLLTLRIRVS